MHGFVILSPINILILFFNLYVLKCYRSSQNHLNDAAMCVVKAFLKYLLCGSNDFEVLKSFL